MIQCMSDDNAGNDSFEERLRSMAREVSRSVERITNIDIDEIAESIGVDPERAKEWADTAGRWLNAHADGLGADVFSPGREAPASPPEDPMHSAGPHPLDAPTAEQGRALAALDSGRWTVEPGSNVLLGHGEGPAPGTGLGLVGELRARDWITAEGEVTLVGRHALSRWLEATPPR
jgi:hypothetical protein